MTQGPSEPGPTVSDGQGRPGYSSREQVTRPHVAPPASPPHPPTEAVPSYQPTVPAEVMPPQEPAEVTPAYEPTQVDPRYRDAPSYSNPTVIAPRPQPSPSSREQPTVDPVGPPAAQPWPAPAPAPGSAPDYPPPQAPPASQRASELMRYGPGVPPSQAGVSAEQVWRTGQMPAPPRRPVRVRRLASVGLTVLLLAAAGILLFLRFHHSPFHVTAAPTLSSAQNGCTVNVTGKIPTNGASGTIHYQWVFTPQQGAPQPLSQSVVSGQNDVFVTVAVQGQGHGTATEQVTLQILGPNQETASSVVKVSC
jgi:hypothetical protein